MYGRFSEIKYHIDNLFQSFPYRIVFYFGIFGKVFELANVKKRPKQPYLQESIHLHIHLWNKLDQF